MTGRGTSLNRDYDTVVAIRHDGATDDDLGSRVLTHFEEHSELDGHCAFQEFDEPAIGICAGVEARNAREALATTLKELCAVLGIRASDLQNDDFIELKAEPRVDPEENEYVSQAEIARRIGVSRARAHQLAKRMDFPAPIQPNGRRGGLYRWGDIRAWQERRVKSRAMAGKPVAKKSAA